MTISWPPYGRWAAGYGTDEKALDLGAEVAGRRQGRLRPAAGRTSGTCGRASALSVASDQQEQGGRLSVHPVAEQQGHQHPARAAALYAARSVPRSSHYTDPVYLSRWPDAKDYLTTLKQAAETGLLDLSILQTDKYEEALRQGISSLWAGDDPKAIADQMAAQWDAITDKIGVDKQKAAYAGLGGEVRRLSEVSLGGRRRCDAPAPVRNRAGRASSATDARR